MLEPGHYSSADVSAADYHKDPAIEPSLSSSLARVLVTQTPRLAFLQHPRLNSEFGADDGDGKFDVGSAVHDAMSSGGWRIVTVHGFADWKKGDARKERDRIRAVGFVPLLEDQADKVGNIVACIHEQLAAADISLGAQESVFIAQDRGVWLRAMLDSWSPPFIRDFKVTKINLADDDTVGRHIASMDLDLRAWFYLRVAELVFPDWAGRLKYEWLFVEENEPHGLRVVECDATFREMGRRKGECAIGLWERCMTSGVWPHLEGLSRTVPYPGYAENRWLERETRDGFVQGPMATLRAMEAG